MSRPTLLLINKFWHDKGRAGGVGRYVLQEEHDLRARGWDVVPFAVADADARPSPWDGHFVRARDYSRPRWTTSTVGDAVSLVWNREAARSLDRLLHEVRPDVAHLHNIYHHLSPSILPVLMRHGVPAVMTLHDLRLLCPAIHMLRRGRVCERCRGGRFHQAVLGRCVKDSTAASLLAAIETAHQTRRRLYLRAVSRFLCPSDFYRRKFVEWGYPEDRLAHLPNFVDLEAWRPADPPDGGAPDGVLYFGRLSREKGLATLLEAHARWARRRADAGDGAAPVLRLAGEGPLEAELRRSAAAGDGRVEFLGSLTPDALRRELARARFTVLPSEWYENGPLALIESLAAGVPVVGADIGGIPEHLRDGREGVLFRAGDPAALAEALARADSLPPDARAQARRAAETRFSRKDHMDRLESILHDANGG